MDTITMNVVLKIRLESIPEERAVWWADCDEVPGFYVANNSLRALQDDAEIALREILLDEHGVTDVVIGACFVDAEQPEVKLPIEVDDGSAPGTPPMHIQTVERILQLAA